MSEMVKFAGAGTGLATREDLSKALNNAAMAAPSVGGDKQFLKLDKGNGDWVYGQEETQVEDGSLWAVNPHSIEYGYIAWDEAVVEGEVMVPISRPLPTKDVLRTKDGGAPKGQNGWQFQQSVDLVCITGEDIGTVCQYKQSSVGSQKLFKSLTNAIGVQLQRGAAEIVPIVVMKSDSYKHKKYGKIFNPIFEIVEWRTIDDDSAPGKAPAAGVTAKAPEVPAEGSAEEDAALAAEYEAAKNKPDAAAEPAPRRRVRR